MMREKVLVVDDDEAILWTLTEWLRDWDYISVEAATASAALAACEVERPAAVLLDLGLPDRPGLDVLDQIKGSWPQTVVVIITGYADTDNALRAGRRDAFDFIAKPIDRDRVRNALLNGLAAFSAPNPEIPVRGQVKFDDIVGQSAAIQSLVEFVRRAAASAAPVLLEGESGTGKELVAKAIHYTSERADGPFVAVNCGALNPNLIESELFGHEKGSFTGSVARMKGRFERADRGTLFLDEIADLPLEAQVKLLRALQERRIERVGGTAEIPVDVRIIAATNRDLKAAVASERFRKDLYYRLGVMTFVVPPLRTRGEDIRLLAEHFLAIHSAGTTKTVRGFTPEAMDALLSHSWPGNVRELSNVIERALALEDGEIIRRRSVTFDEFPEESAGAADAGLKLTAPSEGWLVSKRGNFDDLALTVQRELIIKALKQCYGQREKAARILGFASRHQLYRRMNKLHVSDEFKD